MPHKLAIEHWRSLTSGSSQFIEWEAALTQRAKSWIGGRWRQGGGRSNRRGWDRGGSHRRRTSHPIRSEIYYTLMTKLVITVDLSFQKMWCDMAYLYSKHCKSAKLPLYHDIKLSSWIFLDFCLFCLLCFLWFSSFVSLFICFFVFLAVTQTMTKGRSCNKAAKAAKNLDSSLTFYFTDRKSVKMALYISHVCLLQKLLCI